MFSFIMDIWEADNKWAICGMIALGAVSLQYSGLNWRLFKDLCYELKYPLGRLIEMLPLAACGLAIGHFKVFEKIRGKVSRVYLITGLIFLLMLITTYSIFIRPDGFGYSGIKQLVVAVCLVYLFWLLPFDWCSDKMKVAISQITNYTLGIYCLHLAVGNILRCFVWPRYGVKAGTFVECIIVYIGCYMIATVIAHSHIPGIHVVVE